MHLYPFKHLVIHSAVHAFGFMEVYQVLYFCIRHVYVYVHSIYFRVVDVTFTAFL